jgi:hypothetical protein
MPKLRLRTRILGATLALIASTGLSTAAQATVYLLNGVTFQDGGTASGFFSTDTTGAIDAFSILTSPIATFPGYDYEFASTTFTYTPGDSQITFARTLPGTIAGYLQLFTISPINSVTSGALPLLTFPGSLPALPSSECLINGTCQNTQGRLVTSGSLIISTPETAVWGMMVMGLAAIGFSLRRAQATRAKIAFAPTSA